MNVFSVSKCRLLPRLGIVISKISIFRDIFDCNKVTLSCLKCSTMDPWLKLKFPKHQEVRILTFLIIFSASKCRVSHRLGMGIGKLVYLGISLIVTN